MTRTSSTLRAWTISARTERHGHRRRASVFVRLVVAALHAHYGQRVVILIDEYDTPVQSGYSGMAFDDIVLFFGTFVGVPQRQQFALQGGAHGHLRVSRENMFSGLNHIDVYLHHSRAV
ncbi:MAG: AAA family ATPase [Polyangiaceae bacterium]|nr:AAA family ATPase [Polyangiaceae bacterium]